MKNKKKITLLEDWYRQDMLHLYNYIVYRIPDEIIAEEILMVTCDRALTHLDQFDPRKGAFKAWMYGIARNALTDHFRSRGTKVSEISLDALPPIQGKASSPEEKAIQAEQFGQIILLMKHLSEKEREALALRYGSELKYQEIAEVMNTSIENVGVLLHRALHKLKNLMNEKEEEHEH